MGGAWFGDATADLLLGGRCVGCARPGRVWCACCQARLPVTATLCWPTPRPEGLAPPWAVAEYDGAVRSAVVAYKEHAVLGLAPMLAGLLTRSVESVAPTGPLWLVGVPGRPGQARRRGQDPMATLVRGAARSLTRQGRAARDVSLLVHRGGVADQAGLSAAGRAENLAGALCCPSARLRRLSQWPPGHVVVCDDVLTTGSTAREAQRALESVGLTVAGIAAVAATVRRSLPSASGAG